MTETVYIKCNRSVTSMSPDIYFSDIASLSCKNPRITAGLKSLKVHHFKEEEPERCVISALRLVELIESKYPEVTVEIIGESDVLIEWKKKATKGWIQKILVVCVCVICFCGTAFTIMSYHNDVSINTLFSIIYRNVMGREPDGFTLLEVTYSIGLAVGITVFFNHAGPKMLTKDPTPIEVSLKIYEEDVDRSIIELAERARWEIEDAASDHKQEKRRKKS